MADKTERTDTEAFEGEAREALEAGRDQQAHELEHGEDEPDTPEPEPKPQPDPDGPDTPTPDPIGAGFENTEDGGA